MSEGVRRCGPEPRAVGVPVPRPRVGVMSRIGRYLLGERAKLPVWAVAREYASADDIAREPVPMPNEVNDGEPKTLGASAGDARERAPAAAGEPVKRPVGDGEEHTGVPHDQMRTTAINGNAVEVNPRQHQ